MFGGGIGLGLKILGTAGALAYVAHVGAGIVTRIENAKAYEIAWDVERQAKENSQALNKELTKDIENYKISDQQLSVGVAEVERQTEEKISVLQRPDKEFEEWPRCSERKQPYCVTD